MKVSEEVRDNLSKKELELLVGLAEDHQRGMGLGGECYMGSVYHPPTEEDKISAECLFIKGYLGKPIKKAHFIYRLGLIKKKLGEVREEDLYQITDKTIESLGLQPF